MNPSLLDNPVIASILFYPRQAERGSFLSNVIDGTIPITEEKSIVLGYRLYKYTANKPVILYFHGNGEIASDHDDIAPGYHRIGASLFIVDYRGYGWSTGKPKVSALLSDVESVHQALPDVLSAAGLSDSPLIVMGRSLGSICAIHYAHLYPEVFKCLIIESGFAHTLPLLARLGVPAHMLGSIPDPIGNAKKIKDIQLPLLVIHGERDSIISVANGQALYDVSPAKDKTILRVPNAGHNDLLYYASRDYFAAIEKFMNGILG